MSETAHMEETVIEIPRKIAIVILCHDSKEKLNNKKQSASSICELRLTIPLFFLRFNILKMTDPMTIPIAKHDSSKLKYKVLPLSTFLTKIGSPIVNGPVKKDLRIKFLKQKLLKRVFFVHN